MSVQSPWLVTLYARVSQKKYLSGAPYKKDDSMLGSPYLWKLPCAFGKQTWTLITDCSIVSNILAVEASKPQTLNS